MGRRKQNDQAYWVTLAETLDRTPHTGRDQLIGAAMVFHGISRNTVYSRLRTVGWTSGRKTRKGAGERQVPYEVAQMVSAIMVGSVRANGKRLLSVEAAMDIARANGFEISVSPSTMLRALRDYGLHPKQLMQPSPHTPMRSLYPNHVWQVDASICVLYYLDNGGLAVMDEKRFNDNKPKNYAKVSKNRVIRYIVTDHYSGAFYVRYFLRPGEDSETLFEFLVDAFSGPRHKQDPFHGVPERLIWDAGSANQSRLIKGFLDLLSVDHRAHAVGNPRAKGQVERTHDLVERDFEGRLFMLKVDDLSHLNDLAGIWMRSPRGNARLHSRTNATRYGLWSNRVQEHLRLCPPREVCEQLLSYGIEERIVKSNMMISYALNGKKSHLYSVARVPGVMIGDEVGVSVNPYRYPNVDVRLREGDQWGTPYECEPEETDDAGFLMSAAVFGEEFKRKPDTLSDRNRKDLLKQTYDVDTLQEADKRRSKREPAFDSNVDPFSYLEDQTIVGYLNRPGRPLDIPGHVEVELRPLSALEIMERIAAIRNRPLTRDENKRIRARYPDGVAESALEEVMSWLATDGQSATSKAAVNN